MVKLKNLDAAAHLEMLLVEVTGIEPVSKNALNQGTTSVVSVLI